VNKKHIPLSCLGPRALEQLKAAGVDVDARLAKERGKIKSPDIPFHKFHVVPGEERTFDGIKFDSKLEMNMYRKLKELNIPFERQPEFVLQEGFEHDGRKERPIKYVADFRITAPDGSSLVVDAKGVRTRLFELKRKMMLQIHGIEIHNIRSLPELVAFLSQHGLLNRNSVSQAC
jgi:hypothetical protein